MSAAGGSVGVLTIGLEADLSKFNTGLRTAQDTVVASGKKMEEASNKTKLFGGLEGMLSMAKVVGAVRIGIDGIGLAVGIVNGKWESAQQILERLPFGLGAIAQSVRVLYEELSGVTAELEFQEKLRAEEDAHYQRLADKLNDAATGAEQLRKMSGELGSKASELGMSKEEVKVKNVQDEALKVEAALRAAFERASATETHEALSALDDEYQAAVANLDKLTAQKIRVIRAEEAERKRADKAVWKEKFELEQGRLGELQRQKFASEVKGAELIAAWAAGSKSLKVGGGASLPALGGANVESGSAIVRTAALDLRSGSQRQITLLEKIEANTRTNTARVA